MVLMPICLSASRTKSDIVLCAPPAGRPVTSGAPPVVCWRSFVAASQTGGMVQELGQPAVSQYRLRVGSIRVYYDVSEEESQVTIVMIREKGSRTTAEVNGDEDD